MVIGQGYKKYLKSAAWQAKRQAAFAYYGKRCYACRTFRGPIQMHHLTYARLGHERLEDLRPLCAKCHKEVTALHWKLGKRKFNGTQVFTIFLKQKGRRKTL